jgi:nucleotide-binding universal stress UspA family protein
VESVLANLNPKWALHGGWTGLNPLFTMNTTPLHPTHRVTAKTTHAAAAKRARQLERMMTAQARMHAAQPRASGTAQRTGAARYVRLESILVPLDFSESSLDALRFALPFARESGARLDLLHVIEPVVVPLGPPGEGAYAPQTDNIRVHSIAFARLKKLAAVEVRRPVHANILVKEGAPARVISDVAGEHRSDLLIVSTHGRTGMRRFFLGSTAEAVVRRAPCPVLTVRRRVLARSSTPQSPPSERINRILVPVDFSAPSRTMLQYAVAFATQFRASLVLLHVVDRIDVPSRVVYYATRVEMVVLQRGMAQLAELARDAVPPDIEFEQIVRPGRPYDVINRVARREHADLIMISTRGHGAVKQFFIGSTAGRVVRHAPCPVLVVR